MGIVCVEALVVILKFFPDLALETNFTLSLITNLYNKIHTFAFLK